MDRGAGTQLLSETPALADPRLEHLEHQVIRHGPVSSLAEAAEARGVTPAHVVKTMVVRRGSGDYLFVLVPGDRNISWPKLREHLSVNRISMPDAEEARDATGYERGTITPFGATNPWPVLADLSLSGIVSIGGGAHGISLTVDAANLFVSLDATMADITEPV